MNIKEIADSLGFTDARYFSKLFRKKMGVDLVLEVCDISVKGTVVSFEEELKNLENYISIQQYRFKNKFTMHVDIEPEEKKQILACQLPKLCLQPLVENAILHAFNEITTGGRVTLKAFCTDGNLSIVVADNGSGMSPEQLKKLDASIHAEHVEEGKEHGIGLHNVNRRIQLLFGKEWNLPTTPTTSPL